MIKDEQWPIARLIPISSASGIEAQERRAASALLAVIGAVPEFGRALLRPLGAPAGKIEAFIEVPFKVDGHSLRPDGIITMTRGNVSWGALLEAKTGGSPLDASQLDLYIDLARELDFDAVITISNQFASSSTEFPVEVDRRKLRKVVLHHWSWIFVLTEAVVQKEYRGVADPDQAYILNELIRYLSDPRSGAVAFQTMGTAWVTVRDKVRDQTLRKSDPEARAVAARWDELVRYMALDLTKDLGRDVRQVLTSAEQRPERRLDLLTDALLDSGQLRATLRIPDTAGDLNVMADIRSRQILASTRLEAPRDGRARGRVSWLLRQLQSAPENLRIEARAPYASATLAATLAEARVRPEMLYPEDKDIREFFLTLSKGAGLNRDVGRGSFIDSVLDTTKEFYSSVLQGLREWKAPAPKLAQHVAALTEAKETIVQRQPQLDDAVAKAEREMEKAASVEQPK